MKILNQPIKIVSYISCYFVARQDHLGQLWDAWASMRM